MKADYEAQLESERSMINELNEELANKKMELSKSRGEADRLQQSIQSITARHSKLQAAYREMEEEIQKLQSERRRGGGGGKGGGGGWLSLGMGSMLTGGFGGGSAAGGSGRGGKKGEGDAASGVEGDVSGPGGEKSKSKSGSASTDSDELSILRSELMQRIQEVQSLHASIAASKTEHEAVVATLQRKIEEMKQRSEKEQEEKSRQMAELEEKVQQGIHREMELGLRITKLNNQLASSNPHDSTLAQRHASEWMAERRRLRERVRVAERVWNERLPFDDEAPILHCNALSHGDARDREQKGGRMVLSSSRHDSRPTPLYPTLYSLPSRHRSFHRSRAELVLRGLEHLQEVGLTKLARQLIKNNLVKHWINKWHIFFGSSSSNTHAPSPHEMTRHGLMQQTMHGYFPPPQSTSHPSSQIALPTPAQQALLQNLSNHLSYHLDVLQKNWDASVYALSRVAGRPSPPPPSSSIRLPLAADQASNDALSPTLSAIHSHVALLDPLLGLLCTLAQIVGLHASIIDQSMSSLSNIGASAAGGMSPSSPTSPAAAAQVALASQYRTHLIQLSSSYKSLHHHLQHGASELAKILDLPMPVPIITSAAPSPMMDVSTSNDGNSPSPPSSLPPQPIATLVASSPSMVVSHLIPAAWMIEWVLCGGILPSSGAIRGSTKSAASMPSFFFSSSHFLSYLSSMQTQVTEVASRFAVVAMHEHRQSAVAMAASASATTVTNMTHSVEGVPASSDAVPGSLTPSTASADASRSPIDSASAAIIRSRLNETNNKLLFGLNTLPKLVEILGTGLKGLVEEAHTEMERTDGMSERQTLAHVHRMLRKMQRREERLRSRQQRSRGVNNGHDAEAEGEQEDDVEGSMEGRQRSLQHGENEGEYNGESDEDLDTDTDDDEESDDTSRINESKEGASDSILSSSFAPYILAHRRDQGVTSRGKPDVRMTEVSMHQRQVLTRMRERCTSFLATLNRSTPDMIALASTTSSAPSPSNKSEGTAESVKQPLSQLHVPGTLLSIPLPRSIPCSGLPYSFALQQRQDLHQLTADFNTLHTRYSELSGDYSNLQRIHQQIQEEHQRMLDHYEEQLDSLGTVQLDYFEEKNARENLQKHANNLQIRINRLKNDVENLKKKATAATEEKKRRRRRREKEEEAPTVEGVVENGEGHASDHDVSDTLGSNGDESESSSDSASSIPVRRRRRRSHRHHQHQHQPGSTVDDATGVDPTAGGWSQQQDAALMRALQADGGGEKDDTEEDDGEADAPIIGVQLQGDMITAVPGVDEGADSFLIHPKPPPPPSRPSDWIIQAQQFEKIFAQVTAEKERQRQKEGEGVVEKAGSASFFSIQCMSDEEEADDDSLTVDGGKSNEGDMRTPLRSRPSVAQSSASSAASLTPQLLAALQSPHPDRVMEADAEPMHMRPLEESIIGEGEMHQARTNTELDSAIKDHPQNATDDTSPTAALIKPAIIRSPSSNTPSDSISASPPTISPWIFFQLQSRLSSALDSLNRCHLEGHSLRRENARLNHALQRCHRLLLLLQLRASAASSTSAATLERLQELQLERSETLHSYTTMMDELTDRIFQLTQQLAEKDAKGDGGGGGAGSNESIR